MGNPLSLADFRGKPVVVTVWGAWCAECHTEAPWVVGAAQELGDDVQFVGINTRDAWDPKEVWAFITWVVYAAYLHARATAGWRGRKAAYLALLGMATLWFNFIGINYFSSTTQHGYASGAPALSGPTLEPISPSADTR